MTDTRGPTSDTPGQDGERASRATHRGRRISEPARHQQVGRQAQGLGQGRDALEHGVGALLGLHRQHQHVQCRRQPVTQPPRTTAVVNQASERIMTAITHQLELVRGQQAPAERYDMAVRGDRFKRVSPDKKAK